MNRLSWIALSGLLLAACGNAESGDDPPPRPDLTGTPWAGSWVGEGSIAGGAGSLVLIFSESASGLEVTNSGGGCADWGSGWGPHAVTLILRGSEWRVAFSTTNPTNTPNGPSAIIIDFGGSVDERTRTISGRFSSTFFQCETGRWSVSR